MTPKAYRPRKAAKKWLEEAPPYVLSCHDAGENSEYRYAVCLGGSHWGPGMGRVVSYYRIKPGANRLSVGASFMSRVAAHERQVLGFLVRWLDLPEGVRQHLQRRAEFNL